MKLAQSLAVGQRFILDVPISKASRIYESIISVLETNRRALDIEALKRAVSWLSDARQILAPGWAAVRPSALRKFSIACFASVCR